MNYFLILIKYMMVIALSTFSLHSFANEIDGEYIAGYQVTYIYKPLNEQSNVGKTDVFSMVVKDGEIKTIVVEKDPAFNRAKTTFDEVIIDPKAKTARGPIKQIRMERGNRIVIEMHLDISFGEKTFVGAVDIELKNAGGRTYNKVVEKGVFEGIKIQ